MKSCNSPEKTIKPRKPPVAGARPLFAASPISEMIFFFQRTRFGFFHGIYPEECCDSFLLFYCKKPTISVSYTFYCLERCKKNQKFPRMNSRRSRIRRSSRRGARHLHITLLVPNYACGPCRLGLSARIFLRKTLTQNTNKFRFV